jgi:UDP-N-acetylglucosamine acyltransferase
VKREAIAGTGTRVHPTAVLDGEVAFGAGCRVDPYVVLQGPLSFGADSRIGPSAVVEGPAEFGAGTRIHPHAVLGGPPQDRTWAGEPTRLVVGDGCVFREHVTVHRGTVRGGGETRIGRRNLWMAGSHVAHDCRLGDGIQAANGVTLAGHVEVGDHVILGGQAAVAQFVRIGEGAMVAGGARVDRDIPPFCVARGDRAAVAALNLVGLRRRGVPTDALRRLRRAFDRIFREAGPYEAALRACEPLAAEEPLVARLLAFLAGSRLGVRRETGR